MSTDTLLQNMGQHTEIEAQAPVEAETPETAEVPEPAKPDKFAAKFAALSRTEKEVKARLKAAEQRELALAAKEKELADKLSATSTSEKTLQEKFKENPLKALQEIGVTYEQLSEIVLNDQHPTTEMQMKRMREELEQKTSSQVEELKRQLAEKDEREAQMRYQQVEQAFKAEIKSTVEANADKFELVKEEQAYDLVYEVMEEYYKQTNKVLDVADAINEVEAHLENEAKRILKLKKFQQTSQKNEPGPKKTTPTLSNALSSEAPINGRKKLSNEESLREAAKLIRWDD